MKAFLTIALVVAAACKGDDPAPVFPDSAPPDAELDASPACFDPSGTPANCYLQDVCAPTDDEHFLNACTDGQCIAYDNVARLPRYNNGNLPPLP